MSTQYIKAPYNFVPLSEKVVYPEWAEFISHDVPFEDGESGEITVKVKAHSPIYVRQGGEKKKEEKEKNPNFSQYDGKYFIPGSSIKGAVRNVLEIMTFSRMGRKIQDDRYAIRDLSGNIKQQYLSNFSPDKIFAGWLRKNTSNQYQIIPCEKLGRISHRHLDAVFGTDFSSYFSDKNKFNAKKDKEKSALFKYDRFSAHDRKVSASLEREDAGRLIYEINTDGEKGEIVFTGQPGIREQKPDRNGDLKWVGHHLEFVFIKPDEENPFPIYDSVIKDFLFAYYEHDKSRWSVDWNHWRSSLFNGGKIPVFFHKEGNNVTALGLSYLFKLPYKNSVEEALPDDHKALDIDFSEALFGFINEKKDNDSLKGRVHFSPAFARQETVVLGGLKKEVLSSPKASYYPNYIRQSVDQNGKVKGHYKTFMNDKVSLAGWKRYPIRKGMEKSNPKPEKASKDLTVEFIPLQAGAEFEYKIRYHNLRKVELGALLSALTFHNTKNTFHSIGMAKPLGYGKITFDLDFEQEKKELYEECMRAFEAYMEAKGIKNWSQSDQICELITMASEPNNDAHLEYMKLDTKGNNDFTKAKKIGEALNQYSKLNGISKRCVNTLKITQGDIDNASEDIKLWEGFRRNKQEKHQGLDETRNNFNRKLDQEKNKVLEKIRKRQEQLSMEELRKIQERQEQEERAIKEELQKIRAQQEQMAIEERKNKRAEEAKAAKEDGPSWDEIDLTHRDAFKNLKKAIELFVQKLNKGVNYDKLKKTSENPLLPEKFQGELQEKLHVIFGHLNSKGKKSWKKENNADQKKVAEWIGDKKAADYFNQL